jgi:cytochrome c5
MSIRRTLTLAITGLAAAACLAQCTASEPERAQRKAHDPTVALAWQTIYGVLQHPRCVNCHPAGDVPLQGDDSRPHAQNVVRGPDGKGLFAMRCETCHGAQNVPGAHMPPGVPGWHLPRADMPLVFEGKSSGELCRQLRDPARNGGQSPEKLYEHMEKEALVLWGWNPGEGRAPVPTPHADLLRAMRTWIDAGCECPP